MSRELRMLKQRERFETKQINENHWDKKLEKCFK